MLRPLGYYTLLTVNVLRLLVHLASASAPARPNNSVEIQLQSKSPAKLFWYASLPVHALLSRCHQMAAMAIPATDAGMHLASGVQRVLSDLGGTIRFCCWNLHWIRHRRFFDMSSPGCKNYQAPSVVE